MSRVRRPAVTGFLPIAMRGAEFSLLRGAVSRPPRLVHFEGSPPRSPLPIDVPMNCAALHELPGHFLPPRISPMFSLGILPGNIAAIRYGSPRDRQVR